MHSISKLQESTAKCMRLVGSMDCSGDSGARVIKMASILESSAVDEPM